MVNGYYNHRNDIADISVNASYAQHQYRSLGTSIQGGFTATMNGAAFHPSGINGGTRLMLSTEGADNIPINNGILHSNSFGIAVLTNINSYYRTDTSIDINKIADDVDVNNSIVESALTDGAIGFRKFNILRGNKGFVIIRLKQGNFPLLEQVFKMSKEESLASLVIMDWHILQVLLLKKLCMLNGMEHNNVRLKYHKVFSLIKICYYLVPLKN